MQDVLWEGRTEQHVSKRVNICVLENLNIVYKNVFYIWAESPKILRENIKLTYQLPSLRILSTTRNRELKNQRF
jgi:hypothetical protein